MNFPQNLKYTNEHEWIRVEGDIAYVGITDYAQEQLGDIVFVDIPTVGETLEAGEVFGTIEVVKTISDLFLPVAGEVIELNEALEKNPELASRVQHFRSDNFRLQNEERGNLLQDAEQLARESAELRRNPEVNAYLDAELALCRMMQQICKTLTDGIEIKVPEI